MKPEIKDALFCINRFKHDDQAIHFYMGLLNYSALWLATIAQNQKLQSYETGVAPPSHSPSYQISGNYNTPGPKRKFTTVDKFFMVLVRF